MENKNLNETILTGSCSNNEQIDNAVYDFVLNTIDFAVDIEPQSINDIEFHLSSIVNEVNNGFLLEITDNKSEDYYHPYVEKTTKELEPVALKSLGLE